MPKEVAVGKSDGQGARMPVPAPPRSSLTALSKSRDPTGGLLAKAPPKLDITKRCRPEREGLVTTWVMRGQRKGDTREDSRVLARVGELRRGAGLEKER